MNKWFDTKFEKNNLRRYTTRRLKSKNGFGSVDRFFRKFSITNWLIMINILVFIVIVLLKVSMGHEKVYSIFALQANSLFSGSYWTLITSMFSHIYLPHLIFNMISLFFIGNLLEKIIGRKKFFWFYMLSGLFAGLFYATLSFYFGNSELGAKIFIDPTIFSLGASGAIFGIAGLLAVLTPFMRIYLIAGPIFALILQSVFMSIYPESSLIPVINLIVTFYFFFAIFSMFSFNPNMRKLAVPLGMPFWILPIIAIVPLVIIGLYTPLPIGNTAHLGGLIAGFIYGFYLRKRYKKKTAMIRNYFSNQK